MNIEIIFGCHVSPWATFVKKCKCIKYKSILYILSVYILSYANTSCVHMCVTTIFHKIIIHNILGLTFTVSI